MSLIVAEDCEVVAKFPIPLLASQLQGANQQFAALLEAPYVEITLELQAGEDAEHKIRTFCGLEEIPDSTQHSLLSALHTLLQDDRKSECARTSALPSLASLTSQVASSLQLKPQTSQSACIETVLSSRFARTACAWRAAYAQSWQPEARRADILHPTEAHILTAARATPSVSDESAEKVDWAADEFSMPVQSLVDNSMPALGLNEFMDSPKRFAEVFNLMVRSHPNHVQHLRLLFTLERQFAKTLGATFSSMERALWLLQEQQNREMEKASHLALTDPAKIADLVHSHLDQRRLVEDRWSAEIQALKRRQIKEYSEFVFNFHRSHILPTLLTQPRSSSARVAEAPWMRAYDFSLFTAAIALPPSAAAAIVPLPNISPASRPRGTLAASPAWNAANASGLGAGTALNNVGVNAMLNQQQNSIASSASSIAGGSVNSVAYSGQSVANVAPEPPANAQAAAHAQQVAALLAAQAQEQKERERDEAEVSLNASLVGSGARQKLQEIVVREVWLGGQRKTMFTIRLIVGDLLDLLACEFGPSDLGPRCSTLHTIYSDSLCAAVVPNDSVSLLEIAALHFPDIAQLLQPWLNAATGGASGPTSQSASGGGAMTSRGLGGSLSPRIRALVAAIERTTDFHFPTLAAQIRHALLALAADSPTYRPFLHRANQALLEEEREQAKAAAPAEPEVAPEFLAANASRNNGAAPIMDKLFGELPNPKFSSELVSTPSVLDREDADDNETPKSPAARPSEDTSAVAIQSDAALQAEQPPAQAAPEQLEPPKSVEPAVTEVVKPAEPTPELPPPPHMLEAGDYLVTRHSNLRDVHLLFHLMGTKPPKRAKVGKSDMVKTHAQALEGLRQIMLTADRSGVSSLVVPVLLSGTYKGTKHSLPPATQRELESVFRSVRTSLLELANSAACGSTDHSLQEIKLLIPLADAAAVLHTTPFETLMEFALIKQARAAYAEAFSW